MSLWLYRLWLSFNRPVGSRASLDWLSNLAALLINGLAFVLMAHWYALAYAGGFWDLKVILLAFWLFFKAAAARIRVYYQQLEAAKLVAASQAVRSSLGVPDAAV